jgi:hypothetical protein
MKNLLIGGSNCLIANGYGQTLIKSVPGAPMLYFMKKLTPILLNYIMNLIVVFKVKLCRRYAIGKIHLLTEKIHSMVQRRSSLHSFMNTRRYSKI